MRNGWSFRNIFIGPRESALKFSTEKFSWNMEKALLT